MRVGILLSLVICSAEAPPERPSMPIGVSVIDLMLAGRKHVDSRGQRIKFAPPSLLEGERPDYAVLNKEPVFARMRDAFDPSIQSFLALQDEIRRLYAVQHRTSGRTQGGALLLSGAGRAQLTGKQRNDGSLIWFAADRGEGFNSFLSLPGQKRSFDTVDRAFCFLLFEIPEQTRILREKTRLTLGGSIARDEQVPPTTGVSSILHARFRSAYDALFPYRVPLPRDYRDTYDLDGLIETQVEIIKIMYNKDGCVDIPGLDILLHMSLLSFVDKELGKLDENFLTSINPFDETRRRVSDQVMVPLMNLIHLSQRSAQLLGQEQGDRIARHSQAQEKASMARVKQDLLLAKKQRTFDLMRRGDEGNIVAITPEDPKLIDLLDESKLNRPALARRSFMHILNMWRPLTGQSSMSMLTLYDCLGRLDVRELSVEGLRQMRLCAFTLPSQLAGTSTFQTLLIARNRKEILPVYLSKSDLWFPADAGSSSGASSDEQVITSYVTAVERATPRKSGNHLSFGQDPFAIDVIFSYLFYEAFHALIIEALRSGDSNLTNMLEAAPRAPMQEHLLAAWVCDDLRWRLSGRAKRYAGGSGDWLHHLLLSTDLVDKAEKPPTEYFEDAIAVALGKKVNTEPMLERLTPAAQQHGVARIMSSCTRTKLKVIGDNNDLFDQDPYRTWTEGADGVMNSALMRYFSMKPSAHGHSDTNAMLDPYFLSNGAINNDKLVHNEKTVLQLEAGRDAKLPIIMNVLQWRARYSIASAQHHRLTMYDYVPFASAADFLQYQKDVLEPSATLSAMEMFTELRWPPGSEQRTCAWFRRLNNDFSQDISPATNNEDVLKGLMELAIGATLPCAFDHYNDKWLRDKQLGLIQKAAPLSSSCKAPAD